MKRNFKISNLPTGPRKAHRRFIEQYGVKEGERIYLQKAEEQGKGNTLRQKVIDTYKKRS